MLSMKAINKNLFNNRLKMNIKEWQDASWNAAINKAIDIVETYRVSVGNSRAGELAAEWTMENLREIREELRENLR